LYSSNRRSAEIRAVFTRVDGDWQHYATRLVIPADSPSRAKPILFKQLALLRKTVPLRLITDRIGLIKALATWKNIEYPLPALDLAKNIRPYFYGRFNDYDSLPLWRFQLTNTTGIHKEEPEGPFIHPTLPLFESVEEAAAEWLHDESILQNRYPSIQYLCILKPSLGWFKDLQLLEDDTLSVEVKLPAKSKGWVIKFAAKGSTQSIRKTLKTNPRVNVKIPPRSKEVYLYLIDSHANVYDYFSEDAFGSSWNKTILSRITVLGKPNLDKIIHQGEGETLEYKEWLPPAPDKPKRWDLHKTVVAFANTKGGTILVGVNDDGEVVGIHHPLQETYAKKRTKSLISLYESDIKKMIRHEIAPEVDFETHALEWASQQILAIQIHEGKQKPYRIIINGEWYIRAGANNMHPTNEDLVRLLSGPAKQATIIG